MATEIRSVRSKGSKGASPLTHMQILHSRGQNWRKGKEGMECFIVIRAWESVKDHFFFFFFKNSELARADKRHCMKKGAFSLQS